MTITPRPHGPGFHKLLPSVYIVIIVALIRQINIYSLCEFELVRFVLSSLQVLQLSMHKYGWCRHFFRKKKKKEKYLDILYLWDDELQVFFCFFHISYNHGWQLFLKRSFQQAL